MNKSILIIGGAGFIGSHLADSLYNLNNKIIILDNLESQVHQNRSKPLYLSNKYEFYKGNILNEHHLKQIIEDVEVIYHLASIVSVNQSMSLIRRYFETNALGTANLLDYIVNHKNNVRKLILTSSMSTYGEGAYYCQNCGNINPTIREISQLDRKEWELKCPNCGNDITPIATYEEIPQKCTSIYALTKKIQEETCKLIANTYGIDLTIFRLFNVYGPRQSLTNPYTGVISNFTNRIFINKNPIIYEDGNQLRDFIYVKDVCDVLTESINHHFKKPQTFNIGTGIPIKIKDLASLVIKYFNNNQKINISNDYRLGDIRHCYADISKSKKMLNFKPKTKIENGIQITLKSFKEERN